MKLHKLMELLQMHIQMGMADEEVYGVFRFINPDVSNAVEEVEFEIEDVEPGDGIENIFLLGKPQ